MRVIQLSDLHLGPTTTSDARKRLANEKAWYHAKVVAGLLREQPDADELVVVITGDLTDEGHVNPEEFPPAVEWLKSLPGRVFVVPGNHDVGNFTSSTANPKVDETYLWQWRQHLGAERFNHMQDGHRLIGLNSMIIGSGLDAEANQAQWLTQQLDAAEASNESVWLFQHAPLFLRRPREVREQREHYWCPAASARDVVLQQLDRPCVRGLMHGHIHRRFDLPWGDDRVQRACPALSGTHTDADYFPRDGEVHRHDLSVMTLEHGRVELSWQSTGLEPTVRYAG